MWVGMRVRGGCRRAACYGLSIVLTALVTLWLASDAQAQDRPSPPTAVQAQQSTFDIPPQPLTDALALFGRQSGMQVSVDAGLIRDIQSNGVRGAMSPEQALRQLLAGTGITYRLTGANTAILEHDVAEEGRGPMRLSPIKITASDDRAAASGSGYQGTPDWVYETPSSVSVISREAIERTPTRNARDLLDSVAGVYANRSEGQNPGISVNVRGLQDQNRVVTMIDGARQNFQRNAHGSTQRTYVDSSFIRQVEIEKNATSAVGGAGALGGTVNFRTLIADDLIEPGQRRGTEVNAATGTNEYTFHGSAAVATRIGDRFSVLGGISQRNIGAYDIGKNGNIDIWEGTYRDERLLFTGSETRSGLLKAEADITDNAWLTVGWFHNQTDSSQGVHRDDRGTTFKREDEQDIANNTLTASFDWDPESDLFQIDSQIWYTQTRNKETRGARTADRLGEFRHIDYELATFGGSLQNTSRFALGSGDLSLNYGVEAFRDDGETITEVMIDESRGVDLSYGYRGLNPSGRRDVVSGFTNATWEHGDWLTVSGGLRYDYYNLGGTTKIFGDRTRTSELVEVVVPGGPCFSINHPVLGPITICPPDITVERRVFGPWEQDIASVDVDLAGSALLPTSMVAVKPFDWLQPFVTYSQGYRPPTIMEAFATGGHPGATNNEFAPNPLLGPEQSWTLEVGANLSQDDILLTGDSLRVKVVGFYREIEDYITVGHEIYRPETDFEYSAYVNLDGITRMRGLELEASYDTGWFYIGGAATSLKTDWADTYTYNGESYEAKPGVLFVPPETQFTIDAGVRLFDERLVAGGRAMHATEGVPAYGSLAGTYATDAYTVYDLYGSFALNNHVELRLAANNVTDVAYVPALGQWILPAPGRTFIGSLSLRF